jgi:hypothetical protein
VRCPKRFTVFYEPSLQTARGERAPEATVGRHADLADTDRPEALEISDVAAAPEREVRYEASGGFAELLSRLGVSLLVSTYQAGKLAVVGTDGVSLSLSFHNFEEAIGVPAAPGRLAVGTRYHDVAPARGPAYEATLERSRRGDAVSNDQREESHESEFETNGPKALRRHAPGN